MEYIAEIIKYIIIGIVQGITEILPISSSGHLALTYKLLSISEENQLNLTIFLHLSSSIALCLFFKDIIINIVKGTLKYIKYKTNKEDFMLLLYLIIASIPIAITGLALKPIVEKNFSNMIFISIGFFITSISLFVNQKIKINDNKYNFKNTFITGLFQCISIFPGISRSGITILGSSISKLNIKKGKEFTFLLLIPISIGSSLLSLIEDGKYIFSSGNNICLYTISMIICFVFTYKSLQFFFKTNQQKNYKKYSIYLIIIAFLALTLTK